MKKIYVPVLAFLMIISSCTIYREYRIEVYKPAKLQVPPDIENAAVIYRNFKYPGDTLQNYYRKENELIKANDRQNLDSLLVNECLNELAIHLKNQNVFKEVPVFPYQTFDKHTRKSLSDLPAGVTKQLTTDANAGLLISLETFSYFFSTYPEMVNAPLTNEVVTVAVWGIYDPGKESRAVRKTLIDTIFWNGYDAEGNLQQNYLPPPRLEALKIASAMAGESFARNFYASWQTEKRMYSIPPLPDFSEAAFYIEEEKWDEAIALWKKYTDDRNGKTAVHARYNLALAYEMKDELNTAQRWLKEAQKLAQSYRDKENLQMIQLYQKALNRRQKDIRILEQMNFQNQP